MADIEERLAVLEAQAVELRANCRVRKEMAEDLAKQQKELKYSFVKLQDLTAEWKKQQASLSVPERLRLERHLDYVKGTVSAKEELVKQLTSYSEADPNKIAELEEELKRLRVQESSIEGQLAPVGDDSDIDWLLGPTGPFEDDLGPFEGHPGSGTSSKVPLSPIEEAELRLKVVDELGEADKKVSEAQEIVQAASHDLLPPSVFAAAFSG